MATVELKTVRTLFGEKFFVPSYQRGYRWTTVQVKELLEDLYDFSEVKREDEDYYCLQPVIVKKRGDAWELVDGQQRLTALWLMSALYYCSSKEDVIELERLQYKLQYEEKPLFTALFDKINEFVESGSMRQIKDYFTDEKQKTIDSRNLIESLEYIASFSRKNKTARGVLAKIFDVIGDIKVIWYVLDENEDSIQTFTNINANKIELTNAELIKAVLLNSSIDENHMQNMALQWEEIEKGLNNNSLWNFIVSKKRNTYSTRIDYLFEIWRAKNSNIHQYSSDDRYAVFRYINDYIEKNPQENADTMWNELQSIYETLVDWYNDYFYYHTIGLLIVINEKDKDIDIVKDLYNEYISSDKKCFRKKIKERIKKLYFSFSKSTPFHDFSLDQIRNNLGEITSGDSYVKNVLLLYNIAMLINANNTYERFPFELYKNETWDIEHINPQTPQEASEDEKRAWLESYLDVLQGMDEMSKDSALIEDMQDCLTGRLNNFELIAKRVHESLEITDNNSITNLVLLDASTNRGYKNACFSDKRTKIIEVERTKNNDEKYIPIGTKWVFLKGYEHSKQLIIWSAGDMQDYAADISKSIYTMLGGNE